MGARRKFALVGISVAAALIVAGVIFDQNPQPRSSAAASLVAVRRACEAQTGHRCD